MGGNGPEVLSTFTTDFGGILSGLHRTKIHGTAHLSSSIQVAGVRSFALSLLVATPSALSLTGEFDLMPFL
jgi:hypothetical protein